jgi:hypothetical protein
MRKATVEGIFSKRGLVEMCLGIGREITKKKVTSILSLKRTHKPTLFLAERLLRKETMKWCNHQTTIKEMKETQRLFAPSLQLTGLAFTLL